MKVTVAAIQCALSDSEEENVLKITSLVKDAAGKGAQIILPPELFQGYYFCRHEDEKFFSRAQTVSESRILRHFSSLASSLGVAIPVSFFEKDGPHYFNSLVMLDSDGKNLGLYRKSHIPAGPGYEEKFYFKPGNTGFKVWNTRFAKIGVGVCWDQWFPEVARALVLKGAQILFYPTAIGSEPHDPNLDTRLPWRRAMIGHAVSNCTAVVAANRIGTEESQKFYGHSFVADHKGDLLAEFKDKEEGVLISKLDLEAQSKYQAAFGFFRDRRPELYEDLVKC
jgi:N-carbamoylputrescine amidase